MENSYAQCAECKIRKCYYRERKASSPSYCPRETYKNLVEKTARKGFFKDTEDPESRRINMACDTLLYNGYDTRGPKWTRVEEIINYAKLNGYKKLGIAFCIGLAEEAAILNNILKKNEFEVVSVNCMAGSVDRDEVGFPQPLGISTHLCNPLMQAEILNQENTQLNIMLGLCLGHDILFIKNSKADVTPLVVKDRVLGHNPVAALYTLNFYYRKKLLPEE